MTHESRPGSQSWLGQPRRQPSSKPVAPTIGGEAVVNGGGTLPPMPDLFSSIFCLCFFCLAKGWVDQTSSQDRREGRPTRAVPGLSRRGAHRLAHWAEAERRRDAKFPPLTETVLSFKRVKERLSFFRWATGWVKGVCALARKMEDRGWIVGDQVRASSCG